MAKSKGIVRLVDFTSQFDVHNRVTKVVGSGERDLYSSRIAEDGTVELVKCGTDNLYASIQSHKDSCDIHVLLARYANGDVNALSRVQGVFADITEMPKTYAELLNAVMRGEELFNSLPVEIRAKFDHSLEKFMVSMDSPEEFFDKLGVKNDGVDASSDASNSDGVDSSSPSAPVA